MPVIAWRCHVAQRTARVESPRFLVDGTAPEGTRFHVADSHQVTVTAPERAAVDITLRSGSWRAAVRVSPGDARRLTASGGPVTPTTDLARGRTAFPTSPLPPGMTAPQFAVDGNPRTTWRPGSSGRMVVDLGAACAVSIVRLTWTGGRVCPIQVESSLDGMAYVPVGPSPRPDRVAATAVRISARYLAVTVVGWRPGDAELVELAVM